MEEAEQGKPRAPQQHLIHVLHVDDAEHEDELVEEEVPELLFEVLLLGDSQLPEHQFLDAAAEQNQPAVCHVDHGLESSTKKANQTKCG